MVTRRAAAALALVVLCAVAAEVAAQRSIDFRGTEKAVVEGHTGYHAFVDAEVHRFAAIAVLVRDKSFGAPLWLDDSFLHTDLTTESCRGGVWAVPAGQELEPLGVPVEDYEITDPLGVTWVITKYNSDPSDRSGQDRKWGVAVFGVRTASGSCYLSQPVTRYDFDPSTNTTVATSDEVRYNALLFFPWSELPGGGGSKSYGNGGGDDGDGTRDGNSHAYNPVHQGDHGPRHGHSVKEVDLYWTEAPPDRSGHVVFTNENMGATHDH